MLEPGKLLLVPAHTVHAYGCADRLVLHWVHFQAHVFGGLDLFLYLQCRYEVTCPPSRALAMMRGLQREMRRRSAGSGFASTGKLLELLAAFVDTVDSAQYWRRRREAARFRDVLEHVRMHLEEPIRVSDLADVAGLERTYFSRQFNRVFGISPARYVQRRRIEHAQELLLNTDLTLDQLAERLGFTDGFHLSRMFKRVTGLPPSQFRRRPPQMP
jgi:AraC-like DNA-binding protein